MKILYDDNMPYAAEYFTSLGETKAFTAGRLSEQDLAKCEALLVRSTTTVDAQLLQRAPNLRYVATATSGFNHLSLSDIEAANIKWYAAGGCNARAVAEYILASMFMLAERQGFMLQDKTVGIVGLGNVGQALEALLQALDIHMVKYDPPRAELDASFVSASFEEVISADIISLHVPLTRSGNYPTEHMFNAEVLEKLTAQQILINACRGEVLDNQALLIGMRANREKMPTVGLDCWENEPTIERELIPYLAFATAHIAGHSLEGKARGTDMVYRDLCRFLSIEAEHQLSDFLPRYEAVAIDAENSNNAKINLSHQTIVSQSIKSMYDIENDDSFFRRYMANSRSFSEIRRSYPVRREWPAAKITISNKCAAQTLKKLGFRLANDSK
ncbi:4-phosphoerythronate dehydrogenase [Glaciecola sp. SC05]|uniref:4-phosphoerythronate dehydrogenase n=1 Tax=Glaciecola sp. SC05 TaxID=1987355 RepID=UPI00352832FD